MENVEKGLMDTLRDKAEKFNEKYGAKHGSVTAAKLKQVYDRGIGAYKTNPESVRPNVKSKEQWAFARVNSFLEIYRGAKSANHDKDLLPDTKKAKYANDIFTTEAEAVARSIDLGMEGKVHVSEYDGQAVYMPGETHEAYLAYYAPEYAEEAEGPSVDRIEALRVIVQEVLKEEFQKAEYQGEKVTLNKPRRIQGGNKKFEVFVMDGDKVKRVTFGDPNMEIRRDDPKARANFRSRHSCDTAKDKTSARYWSCALWSDKPVSDIVGKDGNYHILYKTTNRVNGKYYYGVHSTRDLFDGYLGSGVALQKAINAYGKQSFDNEILEFFDTREELLKAEADLVTEDVVKSDKTYNLSLGGTSYVDSLKNLDEEQFIGHQSQAGKLGGVSSYQKKSEEERLAWHKAGRAAQGGTKGMKLKIKDQDAYNEMRKQKALERPRYFCPHCDMSGLDGGNLKQHLSKAHNKGDTFDQVKKECRMWEANASVSDMTKNIEGQILKSDDEQRLVYGLASVVTEKGEPVIDRQGDVIKPDTLVKAVNNFMEHIRVGKQMHNGDQIGVVVHSLPITKEIGDSLGIQSDREGWVVAFKVYDDEVWEKVKSGELAAFSIGGRAVKGEYNGD